MKKIYFAPETVVVNVELQQMIANSPTEQQLNTEVEIESSEEIDSRGGFWSDED